MKHLVDNFYLSKDNKIYKSVPATMKDMERYFMLDHCVIEVSKLFENLETDQMLSTLDKIKEAVR